jgi:hypothetical protein
MSTPQIPPTVSSLIQGIRNLLNQPSADNSFWSDAELLAYINEAVRIYFAELSDIDEGEFVVRMDLDIVSGQELISLPSDFFKVRALYKTISNGEVMLSYRNNLTEGYLTNGGASADTYFPSYSFRNNQLVIRPTPNFSQISALSLEYIAMPYALTDSADAVNAQISPIFRQCVEMYAVYKAKLKESLVTGTDTTRLAKENLADLYKQFKDISALRSKAITSVVPFNPESD